MCYHKIMKEYKQSILIVCLNEQFGQEVAKILADKLGMLFASCKDIVDYEVFDTKQVLEKCGIEYFQKKEKGALKHISKFENAVIFVDYEYFAKGYEYFSSNCNFIYLKAKKKQISNSVINEIAFEERTAELENKCEFVIPLKTTEEKTASEIIKMFRREK